jgi:hypothetical protein
MKLATIVAMTAAVLVPAYASFAQERTQDQTQSQARQTDGDIYGYQLMTPQERNEYRSRMRSANSVREREQIRAEHHEEMQKRAEARGITLPDTPPAARGGGMMGPGRGMGSGGGMSSGGGMGPGGMGRGR